MKPLLVVLSLLLVFVSIDGRAQTPDSLKVEASEYLGDATPVSCDVRNVSGIPVTAYTLALVSRFEDGSTSIAYYSEDFLVSRPAAEFTKIHTSGYLLSGQTKRHAFMPVKMDGKQTADFQVSAVAVVHEDNTAYGNDRLIEDIFEARQAGFHVRSHWLEILEESFRAGERADAFRARLESLQKNLGDPRYSYGLRSTRNKEASARSVQALVRSYVAQVLAVPDRELNRRFQTIMAILRDEVNLLRSNLADRISPN